MIVPWRPLPGTRAFEEQLRNEERFSLTGAAHEPLREDSIGGFRAGERKTYWTKPLPPAPGLWALNGRGCIAGARLRRC
jgi:hypothetical protein